jgi:hypothetical protein
MNCKGKLQEQIAWVAGRKDQPMAILQWISTITARIMRAWGGRYRPERHYMRGAGPASKRSHGAGSQA